FAGERTVADTGDPPQCVQDALASRQAEREEFENGRELVRDAFQSRASSALKQVVAQYDAAGGGKHDDEHLERGHNRLAARDGDHGEKAEHGTAEAPDELP